MPMGADLRPLFPWWPAFAGADVGISSAIVQSGGLSIQVETLGAIVGDRAPSFIKMDVEGIELDALKGAEKQLREASPKLAVCVYHVQDHPWAVPLYIHSVNPAYKFYMRRHREYLDDVVCYAVPGK